MPTSSKQTALRHFALLLLAAAIIFLAVMCGKKQQRTRKGAALPLHDAVMDPKAIADFLESGCDPSAEDKFGNTPLHSAAQVSVACIVERRLERERTKLGINNARSRDAVRQEAWRQLEDSIRLLIDAGADINARRSSGSPMTPLQIAAHYRRANTAKILIKYGADVHTKGASGWTLLHDAARRNKSEIARILLDSGVDVNVRTKNGCTPLHEAASAGHIEVAKVLVEYGANLRATRNHGRSHLAHSAPLVYAARYGGTKVLSFLLSATADDDFQVTRIWPAAMLAAAHEGHENEVDLLLNKGVDVNSKDPKTGGTALHIASRTGRGKFSIDLVELLIAKGADLNAKNVDLMTPLHTAARYGNKDMVRILVDNSANMYIRAKNGKTPLEMATWTVREMLEVAMLRDRHSRE